MYRTLAVIGATLVSIAIVGLVFVYGSKVVSIVDGYERADGEYALFQCLGDIVLAEVPTDEVVFVADWSGSGHGNWVKDEYWLERITELTYPERSVTGDVTQADVVIRLVQEDGGPCDGFDIEVTRS